MGAQTDDQKMHTPGPWRARGIGGSSVVLCPSKPRRNDTRIPAYGYDDAQGHSVAYPFIQDDGGTRLDFVCFSHADAHLIAAAPEMLAMLKRVLGSQWTADDIRVVIAKAEDRR